MMSKEMFGPKPYDDVFDTVFGPGAESMWEFLKESYENKLNMYPKRYVDSTTAREARKDMLAGMIIETLKIEDI